MSKFLCKLFIEKLVSSAGNQKIKNCLECGMVMPDDSGVPDYCTGCQKKPEIQAQMLKDDRMMFEIIGVTIIVLAGIVLGCYFGGFWGGVIGLFIGIGFSCFSKLRVVVSSLGLLLWLIILLAFVSGIIWFIIRLVSGAFA